jgi:hypothetical protein
MVYPRFQEPAKKSKPIGELLVRKIIVRSYGYKQGAENQRFQFPKSWYAVLELLVYTNISL